ncbi:MAG: DUF2795 domain-containing protein [Actinomycetota bacterium]
MAERGSDKSGPRVDEELKRQAEAMERGAPVPSRADEAREAEGPGDDEPVTDARLTGDRGLTPEGSLSPDQLEERSEIARHLDPSVFPADRDTLLRNARARNAPVGVIERLEQLPDTRLEQLPDTRFENVQAVWEALGGTTEERG